MAGIVVGHAVRKARAQIFRLHDLDQKFRKFKKALSQPLDFPQEFGIAANNSG